MQNGGDFSMFFAKWGNDYCDYCGYDMAARVESGLQHY